MLLKTVDVLALREDSLSTANLVSQLLFRLGQEMAQLGTDLTHATKGSDQILNASINEFDCRDLHASDE